MALYKKWWFWLILIFIVAFFYPKDAGYQGGNIAGPTSEHPYSNRECTCIGIKYSSNIILDAGNKIKCIGIPLSCKCYLFWIENNSYQTRDISCGK